MHDSSKGVVGEEGEALKIEVPWPNFIASVNCFPDKADLVGYSAEHRLIDESDGKAKPVTKARRGLFVWG